MVETRSLKHMAKSSGRCRRPAGRPRFRRARAQREGGFDGRLLLRQEARREPAETARVARGARLAERIRGAPPGGRDGRGCTDAGTSAGERARRCHGASPASGCCPACRRVRSRPPRSGSRDIDRALAWPLELDQGDALELAEAELAIAHRHRQRAPPTKALSTWARTWSAGACSSSMRHDREHGEQIRERPPRR